MNAQLTVLTGSTSRRRIDLSGGEITLGRSPHADLCFDPLRHPRVSGLHAAIFRHKQGWAIRDLGSRNGTFLNGHRAYGPSLLRSGDQVQLGEEGPLLEFRLLDDVDGPDFRPTDRAGIQRLDGTQSPRSQVPSLAYAMVGGLWVVLLGVTLFAFQTWREAKRYREQVVIMQERIDNILAESEATAGALQGRIQGLHDALVESRERLERVRREMEAAQRGGSADEVAALRVQVQEAQAALVRQQLAANLDFDAIEAANRRAVVKVYVDFGDEVITATAFAVREDATLLTNRHVVLGPQGDRSPQRVAVQFADSRQVWPARVVATSDVDDLAVLKVDNIVGGVPTILGFNNRPDTVQAGQGVAVIGFPLGGADPATEEGAGGFARTTLTAGVVSALRQGTLEVNGYGVEGSSGSPVFDGDGRLIGVLYGGRILDGERTLFAVAVDRVTAFLRQVP